MSENFTSLSDVSNKSKILYKSYRHEIGNKHALQIVKNQNITFTMFTDYLYFVIVWKSKL